MDNSHSEAIKSCIGDYLKDMGCVINVDSSILNYAVSMENPQARELDHDTRECNKSIIIKYAIRSYFEVRKKAVPILEKIFEETRPDDGHGLEHCMTVTHHTLESVISYHNSMCGSTYFKLVRCGETGALEALLLAALTHDLDDAKISKKPDCYYFDRFIEQYFPGERSKKTKDIIETAKIMISLVSCSKCGDKRMGDYPIFYYIPRYSDRLEAIGKVGIDRCLIYAESKGRPLYLPQTPRVFNIGDLIRVAPHSRYVAYTEGKCYDPSDQSSIGHFYDKIVHINVPGWMKIAYLQDESIKRHEYIINWLFDFWNNLEEGCTLEPPDVKED